jgi:hypothetical protein
MREDGDSDAVQDDQQRLDGITSQSAAVLPGQGELSAEQPTILNLADSGSPQSVSNIVLGSNCTITETLANVQNCQWVTSLKWNNISHLNGSVITNVQYSQPNIEVHNEFICSPPPKP